MSLTTSNITGRVPLPTNEPTIRAVVTFTLVGYDTQGRNAIPSGADAVFTLNRDAEIPAGAKLWQNTAGLRGTVYRMTATWFEPWNMRAQKSYSFGYVQVGDAAEYSIADLLNSAPPDAVPGSWWSSITQDQYDEVIEAAENVESALNGAPWQVVATDAVTGKAGARDLTASNVLDMGFGSIPWYLIDSILPAYVSDEDSGGLTEIKGVPITATAQRTSGTIAVRGIDGHVRVGNGSLAPYTNPDSSDFATTKQYVDDVATVLIAPKLRSGLANPPTAEPSNHMAFGGGAEARHTAPGQYFGGGIAFGISARINGLHHVAIGPLAEVGPRNAADEYDLTMPGTNHSIAVGGASQISVDNGVALGARAKVKHYNSVALGADSDSTAANTVSVGSATIKRRVTNVANPTGNNDAANKVYVDGRLSAAQRTAINALSPIADTSTATTQQVATLLNSIIAALKA